MGSAFLELPEGPIPNLPPPSEVAWHLSAEQLVREALARWGRIWSPNKLDEAVAAVYDWLKAGDWAVVKYDEAGRRIDEWVRD